jgi:Mg/Co/Ni transporter MgtE
MDGYGQQVDGPVLQEELMRLAEDGKVVRFLARARHLHPSDLSDVLASLEEDTRVRLVQALPPEVVSDALAEMEEEEHPEEVLAALRPEERGRCSRFDLRTTGSTSGPNSHARS